MSKIDRAYVDKLQSFTDALEGIVEILKDQSKSSEADGGPNDVNKMLSNVPDTLTKIAEDLTEVRKDSRKTLKNTEEILKKVNEARKAKEGGVFTEVEDGRNKSLVGTGIKTILLIAGAVLAIGLALKLVGKVDILSAIGLGIAILAIAFAFKKVAEIKELTPSKAVMVGMTLMIMSGAILVSGLILSKVPKIGMAQALSIGFIGLALGVAAYGMIRIAHALDVRDIAKILLLPILLPIMAGALVAASYIISGVQPIGMMQALGIVMVGVAMAGAAIPFVLLAYVLRQARLQDIVMAAISIPLIAGATVLASLILQGFQPISDPVGLLVGGVAMGIALLAFAPSVMLLGRLNPMQLVMGTLGAIVVSGAIMVASYILGAGSYDTYPTAGWALGVGLSLLLFTPAIILLGILSMTGFGAVAILAGAAMSLVVAGAIVAVSYILGAGKYDEYPGPAWAAGVGLSMILFGTGIVALGILAITGIGTVAILAGAGAALLVAQTIVWVAEVLGGGNYGYYPSAGWAAGVGLSMYLLGTGLVALGILAMTGIGMLAMVAGVAAALLVAQTVVWIAEVIGNGNYGYYPSAEWVLSVGASMLLFGGSLVALGIIAITGIGMVAIQTGLFMGLLVAASIAGISGIIRMGKYDKYPEAGWVLSVGASMILFGSSMVALGILAVTGIGTVAILAGILMAPLVAASIVSISEIIAKGNYSRGPSLEWALGTGLIMQTFGVTLAALGTLNMSMFGFGTNLLESGSKMAIVVARSIASVSKEIAKGSWANGPSLDWAAGTSYTMVTFAQVMGQFGRVGEDQVKNTNLVASAISAASRSIATGKYTNAPSEDWTDQMVYFLEAFNDLEVGDELSENMNRIAMTFSHASSVTGDIDKFGSSIVGLASNIRELAGSLRDVNPNALDKLIQFGKAIPALSFGERFRQWLGMGTEGGGVSSIVDTSPRSISGFGSLGGSSAGATLEKRTEETRTVGKEDDPQTAIITELKGLNDKLDRLIEVMLKPSASIKIND